MYSKVQRRLVFRHIRLWLLVLILSSARAQAQEKELGVGDTVPNVILNHLIRYKGETAQFSDFKDKLVILDFWSTSCAPCLAALPKLDSLQKKFGDRLLILPVTREAPGKIETFWKRSRFTRHLSLPTVAGDTVLQRLFPHEGVPHEVWIDGHGVVRGITTAQYVDEKNIGAILEGGQVDWVVNRWDEAFDYQQLLLGREGLSNKGKGLFYSAVLPHLAGIKGQDGFYRDSLQGFSRLYTINNTMVDLYRFAFRDGYIYYPLNRVWVEGADREAFIYSDQKGYREEWLAQNTWSYEALLPLKIREEEVRQRLVFDLNQFFDVQGRMEKRTVPCWVIRRNRGAKGKAKKIVPQTPVVRVGLSKYPSMAALAGAINLQATAAPVVDETGNRGQVPIRMQYADLGNMAAVKATLNKYGFDLVQTTRVLEMLVITVKKKD